MDLVDRLYEKSIDEPLRSKVLLARSYAEGHQLLEQICKHKGAVYNHGNTLCLGIGSMRNAGVEVETRSKRMLVLKDFADISGTVAENTVDYPGYYLDKNYKYLVCKTGVSFESKNSEIMTHGGITLGEVVVPFVKIKAVD